MANNVTLPGTGAVVESIDIGGGVERQVVVLGPRSGAAVDVLPAALTAASALRVGGTTANPTSVLTRPADTNAYAQNDLIASSTTAGSVVVPSFTATPANGGTGIIRRCRLLTSATTGMGGVAVQVEFWNTAPTVTNGDNGAYAIATGAAHWLGSMTFASLTQVADGAYGAAVSDVGSDIDFALASTAVIYWTLKYVGSAGFTPISAQTFTLVPEILQD